MMSSLMIQRRGSTSPRLSGPAGSVLCSALRHRGPARLALDRGSCHPSVSVEALGLKAGASSVLGVLAAPDPIDELEELRDLDGADDGHRLSRLVRIVIEGDHQPRPIPELLVILNPAVAEAPQIAFDNPRQHHLSLGHSTPPLPSS